MLHHKHRSLQTTPSLSDTLCAQESSGLVVGSLCADFCHRRSIVPNSCEARHFGKEVVFSAKWNNGEDGQKEVSIYRMYLDVYNK
jgi:hypothetical protein